MRTTKTLAAALLAFGGLIGLVNPVRGDVIAQWNFNGPASFEVPGGHLSPLPSAGAGTAMLIGGVAADPVFASGSSNAGSSDPAGSDGTNFAWQTLLYAPQGTQSGERGVQFNVSTAGESNVVVIWDHRHSNTSSRFVQFQYSIDGTNFTSAGLPNDGIYQATFGGDRWYNMRSANLSHISGVADNPSFAFRIVAVFDPANGAEYSPATPTSTYQQTGTWRFDMVMVYSTDVIVAPVPYWPEVFDPFRLVELNLELDPEDWLTIQGDETLSIEVPGMLWADGAQPILVSVRRKSATPLNNHPDFSKVALKIDINELVSGQIWHGLRKLSLETGDDENVLKEGVAWRFHHAASAPEGYNYEYSAAYASWLTLKINGIQTGVYLSVEQRDRTFLQNRGLWVPDESWMYKVDDVNSMEMQAGPEEDSPLVQELCYQPFGAPATCPKPSDAFLLAELPNKIDMQAMLAHSAVGGFIVGGDQMLTKGKNFRFADFIGGLRQYYPWDLDSTMLNPNATLYPLSGNPNHTQYAQMIFGIPEFRAQYSKILNDLLCGPMSPDTMIAFLDELEPVLTEALDADPNRNFSGSAASQFNSLRNWINERTNNVKLMLEGWEDCPPPSEPCAFADVNCDGTVDILDLLDVLAAWGHCPAPCPEDLDGNGVVNIFDLLIVLGKWGSP